MSSFLCYLRAIPAFVAHGFKKNYFRPHDYEEVADYYENVFEKNGHIRLADGFAREIDENFIYQAHLVGMVCRKCGKKALIMRGRKEEDDG